MSDPMLNVTNVNATIITMDFTDGGLYKGFHGKVTIYSATEAVGFEPTGHNSANWFARIVGPTSAITLMGCQVRAIVEGPAPATRDYLIVP